MAKTNCAVLLRALQHDVPEIRVVAAKVRAAAAAARASVNRGRSVSHHSRHSAQGLTDLLLVTDAGALEAGAAAATAAALLECVKADGGDPVLRCGRSGSSCCPLHVARGRGLVWARDYARVTLRAHVRRSVAAEGLCKLFMYDRTTSTEVGSQVYVCVCVFVCALCEIARYCMTA